MLAKALTAIDRLSVIWKSDLTNKMKCMAEQKQGDQLEPTYSSSVRIWYVDLPEAMNNREE